MAFIYLNFVILSVTRLLPSSFRNDVRFVCMCEWMNVFVWAVFRIAMDFSTENFRCEKNNSPHSHEKSMCENQNKCLHRTMCNFLRFAPTTTTTPTEIDWLNDWKSIQHWCFEGSEINPPVPLYDLYFAEQMKFIKIAYILIYTVNTKIVRLKRSNVVGA